MASTMALGRAMVVRWVYETTNPCHARKMPTTNVITVIQEKQFLWLRQVWMRFEHEAGKPRREMPRMSMRRPRRVMTRGHSHVHTGWPIKIAKPANKLSDPESIISGRLALKLLNPCIICSFCVTSKMNTIRK